jgi:hypothetical protein
VNEITEGGLPPAIPIPQFLIEKHTTFRVGGCHAFVARRRHIWVRPENGSSIPGPSVHARGPFPFVVEAKSNNQIDLLTTCGATLKCQVENRQHSLGYEGAQGPRPREHPSLQRPRLDLWFAAR